MKKQEQQNLCIGKFTDLPKEKDILFWWLLEALENKKGERVSFSFARLVKDENLGEKEAFNLMREFASFVATLIHIDVEKPCTNHLFARVEGNLETKTISVEPMEVFSMAVWEIVLIYYMNNWYLSLESAQHTTK